MCIACGAVICAIFDRMIVFELARIVGNIGMQRSMHSTNIGRATGPSDTEIFAEFIEHAAELGMTPQELETEISVRSGFAEHVSNWIQEKTIPNGLARKIILTNVEILLKERGAQPTRSASELVAA